MNALEIASWLVGTLIVVLGPIILVHELGHFLLAKLAGVRVEEFGFGFPPRLLKLWHSSGFLEVDDARVAIPAGLRALPELETGDWVEVTALQRDDGTYLLRDVKVLEPAEEEMTPGRHQRDEATLLRGEVTTYEPGTLYSLNLLPIGAFVRMTGEEDPSDPRSLAAQPKRWRMATLLAGPALNILAALLLLAAAYFTGLPQAWMVKVADVVPNTAAQEAGLQPQDVIVSVDGERLEEGAVQLSNLISAAPGESLEITVRRGDEKLTLDATPRPRQCEEGEPGCVEGSGFLGILMEEWPDRTTLRRYSPLQAVQQSATAFVSLLERLVHVPAQIVQGEISAEQARPVSVVGAGELLAFTLQQSLEWKLAFPVLQTASFVSLALGLTNLLPLPALDGGRVLFVLIEAIRGRRIPPEREALVHFVGLVILTALMAFIIFQDLVNPVIPWEWW